MISKEKKKLYLSLQEEYFVAIKQGIKEIEVRLGSQKYLSLCPGDQLYFSISGKGGSEAAVPLVCEVLKIAHYPSFKKMMAAEGLKTILPGIFSIEDAISTYRQFYSEADESFYGVVAIFLKKMKINKEKSNEF